MATVGGLSSGTSSGVNMYGASMKGYGGLSTGLDTDSLIEGMTIGTRTKIQDLLKKKTTYNWQTDAYRGVTDQLVAFSKKYLDVSSSSSPYRASFFDKSLVSLSGENSKYLSVTGSSSALDSMRIIGVSQLAKDAAMVSRDQNSTQSLKTGSIDFGKKTETQNLDGTTLSFKYGTQTHTIRLKSGGDIEGSTEKQDYSTMENALKSINGLLDAANIGSDSTKITLEMSGDNVVLKGVGLSGNDLQLSGGSEAALKALGFVDSSGKIINEGMVGAGGTLEGTETKGDLMTIKTFAEVMGGKEISFSYNGVTKSIKMPSAAEIQANWMGGKTELDPATDGALIASGFEKMKDHMQKELNSAFGNGKVTVDLDDPTNPSSLTFKTADNTSVLKVVSGGTGMLGQGGVFNMDIGASNRLSMEDKLSDCGLAGLFGNPNWKTDPSIVDQVTGELKIKINGKDIKGLKADSTLSQVLSKINSSDAGVTIKYLETADKFSITAKDHGSIGKIEFNDGAGNDPTDFMGLLLGAGAGSQVQDGKDAEMEVEYEGGVRVTITRDTNAFNLDGSTFNLKGKFSALNPDGTVKEDDAVTFSSSVDADKVSKVISEMVADYNKMVEHVNKLVSTKPDRNYGPLTDDEKATITQEQITKLEDKAKEGILFNDSLMRSVADRLRGVFSGAADAGTLEKMGLTLSKNYTDNGKIEFNEAKFKSALAENPDKVKDVFTRSTTAGNGGGISVRMKAVTDEFAKTMGATKGSLIEKAGHSAAPTSMISNSIQKMIDSLDKDVTKLKSKLQTEIDRYTKQFTALERLVSQMNSQSSWLSQSM